MIPISIELVNFRAIPYADIDLTEVTVAAICGRNGAGKSSAFTMAPRFALFGDVFKGVSMDELVSHGKQEMAVTFTFEHQDSVFRSIRTRSLKGSGKSTHEFQKQVNGVWESRSGLTIKQTEANICELLNLDDDTFTASSMIMQGKANEFTAKTSGERKDVLQQVMGLNIYEKMQAAARQKSASLNIEIEKLKGKLADINDKLAVKDQKDELLADHQRQLAESINGLEILENDLKQLQTELVELQTKSARATELTNQLTVLTDELTSYALERSTLTAKIERADKILANEAEIIAKHAESEVLKKEIAVLQSKQPRHSVIESELKSIESELLTLAVDILPINKQVESIGKLVANKETLDKTLTEHTLQTANLLEMDKLQLLDQEKQIAYNAARDIAAAARQQFDSKKKELAERIRVLTGKTTMLADSNCIDVTIAACHFLADAKRAELDLTATLDEDRKMDPLECQILDNAAELIAVERIAIGFDSVKRAELKASVTKLSPFAEQAKQLDAKVELLESLRNQIKQNSISVDTLDKRKLALDKEEAALKIELDDLPVKEQQLKDIALWANLKDQLAAYSESKKSATERIVTIDLDVANKSKRKDEFDLESSVLFLDTINFESKKLLIPEFEKQIKAARDQQGLLQVRIGGLQTELQTFKEAELEKKRILTKLDPLSLEWTRYQVLIKAFGKDGIPALIIENAVPVLESIANKILSDMTKGKNYLRFETQRDLKNKAGITETLDIIVGDGAGERKYETYSGGEQLRIDYAIRFALADLLASRAGNKVEWLTIDEGLGSQDPEHRALVLDAIKAVAHRFKKVLVITHLEDAQAAFEQQIYFDNSESGVNIHVA